MVKSRARIARVEEEEIQDQPDAEVARRPFYKRRGVLIIGAVVLLLAAIFGVRYWLYARSHESTDDAFIDGRIIQVSPKVSGYVAKIYVKDNQQVKEGDLIADIDARDYEVRLQQAQAALDAGLAKENEAKSNVSLTRATSSATVQQARAAVQRSRTAVASSRAGAASLQSKANEAVSAISTAQANLAQTQAQVVAAQADVTRANADVERYRELYSKDEVSKQQLTRRWPPQIRPTHNSRQHDREFRQQKHV
jgi:membrane fusion protein (multidrug efflux system)